MLTFYDESVRPVTSHYVTLHSHKNILGFTAIFSPPVSSKFYGNNV